MKELTREVEKLLSDFVKKLEDIYKEDLVSVILYGSAASGEFVSERSNLNLLAVLKNTELNNLAKATTLVNNQKFKMIQALFFTQKYINDSVDVFPIEFLDIKENYAVLWGIDVLKDISVNLKNLRFQCEHELKAKLINLKASFMILNKDKKAVRNLLFKSFTSFTHILRNIIRLKGKEPHYLKQDVIRQVREELPINIAAWEKILAAKNKQVKVNDDEIRDLYVAFAADLERIADLVDKG